MGIFFNEFTGTDGVDLSVGNSGSGGATAVSAASPGIEYSVARQVVGSSSVATPTSGEGTMRWALGGVRSLAIRFYVWLSAGTAATDMGLLRLTHATDSLAVSVNLTSVDKIRILSKGGTDVWDSADVFPRDQWVRIEAYIQQGTGTTGSMQFAFYLGSSLTPIEAPATFTGVTLGGDLGALSQLRVGKTGTAAYPTMFFDSLAWNTDTDATGLIGPPVNAAPTVNAGSNQTVGAAASVGLTATAGDTDGSIASYAWSFLYPETGAPSLTGGTTATPSFTAGAAGNLYVLQCQVVDNQGASASDTVEVRVPSTGNFAPLAMDGVASGAWTRAGSATSDGAALADSNDATYTESPDFTGSAQTEEYRLAPIVARDSLQFVVRASATATGGTRTVSLVDGSTVRQTWTLTAGTSAADQTLNVTTPANIADWGNLRLRFSVVS